MDKEIHELLSEVSDEKSFLEFVSVLVDDCERESKQISAIDPEGWNGLSAEGFLEAALAWAKDTEIGATQGLEDASPWRKFATFLYCGKIYE